MVELTRCRTARRGESPVSGLLYEELSRPARPDETTASSAQELCITGTACGGGGLEREDAYARAGPSRSACLVHVRLGPRHRRTARSGGPFSRSRSVRVPLVRPIDDLKPEAVGVEHEQRPVA